MRSSEGPARNRRVTSRTGTDGARSSAGSTADSRSFHLAAHDEQSVYNKPEHGAAEARGWGLGWTEFQQHRSAQPYCICGAPPGCSRSAGCVATATHLHIRLGRTLRGHRRSWTFLSPSAGTDTPGRCTHLTAGPLADLTHPNLRSCRHVSGMARTGDAQPIGMRGMKQLHLISSSLTAIRTRISKHCFSCAESVRS